MKSQFGGFFHTHRGHKLIRVPLEFNCNCELHLDKQLVDWLFHKVSEKIGIFEAKTKLSELCSNVAESGKEYVITRRGRPVARIVAPIPVEQGKPSGVLARMRRTVSEFGPISAGEAEFPEVWEERWGCNPSPLDENTPEAGATTQC